MRTNSTARFAVLCAALLSLTPTAFSQQKSDPPRFDLSALWGGAKIPGTSFPTIGAFTTTTSSPASLAWQANFSWRIFSAGPTAAFLEFPVTGAPGQGVNSSVLTSGGGFLVNAPRRSAYFFTPGLRLRFLNKRFSPYAVGGYGIESATILNNEVMIAGSGGLASGTNGSTDRVWKGAFDFGGGLDAKLNHLFSLRSEVRDFVRTGKAGEQSGTTVVVQKVTQSRHTLAVSGGLVAQF